MKASIRQKLEKIADRFEEVGGLLADPSLAGGSQEFPRAVDGVLAPAAPRRGLPRLHGAGAQLSAARELAADADPAMREMGRRRVALGARARSTRERELQQLLLPRTRATSSNIFLEVRAGTGGDEAAIFAGDLLRMYSALRRDAGLAGRDR